MKDQQRLDKVVFENPDITKEQISEWLRKDITHAYVIMSELLHNKDVFEALAEVFWKRYCSVHDNQDKQ